jgi:hypothetical protein
MYGEHDFSDVAAHCAHDVQIALYDMAVAVWSADPPAEKVAEFAAVAVDVAFGRSAQVGDGAALEQRLQVEGQVDAATAAGG